jgi:hypothetical protein
MAKKKKTQPMQKMSPRQYLKTNVRKLPIAKCLISSAWQEHGMASILVARQHKSGNYTVGFYLLDLYCLGLKDTFFRFNISLSDYESFKEEYNLCETSYEEAHNLIYGAIAYAEELGIKPHKEFAVTCYLLEEDTEDIPLIEYQFGVDGKPLLVVKDAAEMARYLPILEKSTGGNFNYMFAAGNYPHEDYYYDEDDEEDEEMIDDVEYTEEIDN